MGAEPKTVVFATTNPGKLVELRDLLGPGWLVKSSRDFPQVGEVDETADTFAGNAELKARALCSATGLLSLGDDSGLCVDALGGRPGVYSARYAASDELRMRRLVTELADANAVTAAQRSAHFECALCAVWPDGRVEVAVGQCHGRIGTVPRGTHGFGYDPIFELPDGRTLAELNRDEKALVSHRGAALRALMTKLRA